MKKFGKWMAIGFIVQAIVTGVRFGLGKPQKDWASVTEADKKSPYFWFAFISTIIIGGIINIVLWPVAIIAEIYNTKKGL